MTTLDLANCTKLTDLEYMVKQLTTLNVSGCLLLEKLDCCSNQLATLDVSGCTSLKCLTCSHNRINEVSMNALIANLPQTSGNIYIYDYNVFEEYSEDEEHEGNICTNEHIAAIKAKNWTPYVRFANRLDWTECEYGALS